MLFINATLVMKDHLIPDAYLLTREEHIHAYGRMADVPACGECQCVDLQGMNLAPGLIDIHAHAGGPFDFSEAPGEAADYMLAHGVTSILATATCKMSFDEMMAMFDRYDEAAPLHPSLAGINMEGPYMNVKYGAGAERNPWSNTIDFEVAQRLIDRLGNRVRIWSIAPEREGMRTFMQTARRANPSVIFAAGHSDADAYQTEALLPHGLRLATHLSNAMHNFSVHKGCVRPGIIDAVNNMRDVYAELICDSLGIHVDPYMLRFFRRIKTDERIILISDATVSYMEAGESLCHGKDLNFDHNGDLSGSKLTLDVACRNMMIHTGASLVECVRFASSNPAQLLGLGDRGEIAVDKRADLVVMDDRMRVLQVYLRGARVATTQKGR